MIAPSACSSIEKSYMYVDHVNGYQDSLPRCIKKNLLEKAILKTKCCLIAPETWLFPLDLTQYSLNEISLCLEYFIYKYVLQ